MSSFAVTVEEIGSVSVHPNADRLELATLKGKDFEFVVQKGLHTAGDSVVYFPLDAELPPNIVEALGLTGKLAGKDKNRVKTIRLRGVYSQGVVAKFSDLGIPSAELGQDFTEFLGVTKYEPPEPLIKSGIAGHLPEFVARYDIEGAQNFVDLVESLMDTPVMITEKLEGSHWSASIYEDGHIVVCSRNYALKSDENGKHSWIAAMEEQALDDALKEMHVDIPARCITLRGELIGPSVQGNIYGLQARRIDIFEIEFNGTPCNALEFMELTKRYDIPTVPVLHYNVTLREALNGASVKDFSNGQSLLAPVLREGIVIRPVIEQYHNGDRVILKQRSPEYLAAE